MKAACIVYHSNALKIYQQEWITQCITSLQKQTLKEVDFIELNYGDGADQFTKGEFHKIPFQNHIQAMNYLYDMCFNSGYDVVFNTNIDDYYDLNRFQVQIEAIEQGAQVVSSNFRYIGGKTFIFHPLNIKAQLDINHNIIAHPVVAMHKSAWDTGHRYMIDQLGYEDLNLWQRMINAGVRFKIVPDILLHYRLHPQQVGRINKAAWSVS